MGSGSRSASVSPSSFSVVKPPALDAAADEAVFETTWEIGIPMGWLAGGAADDDEAGGVVLPC